MKLRRATRIRQLPYCNPVFQQGCEPRYPGNCPRKTLCTDQAWFAFGQTPQFSCRANAQAAALGTTSKREPQTAGTSSRLRVCLDSGGVLERTAE